jgi:hypothetical protein
MADVGAEVIMVVGEVTAVETTTTMITTEPISSDVAGAVLRKHSSTVDRRFSSHTEFWPH